MFFTLEILAANNAYYFHHNFVDKFFVIGQRDESLKRVCGAYSLSIALAVECIRDLCHDRATVQLSDINSASQNLYLMLPGLIRNLFEFLICIIELVYENQWEELC